MVVVIDSSTPGRVAHLRRAWRKCLTMTIRPACTIALLGLSETNTIGYYGSGSVWSAHLAARMFSVLQTVLLWGLNPHHWLSTFLQACAENGGTCPTDLSAFLPWHMTPERREELARPAPVMVPPLTPGAQAEEETEAVDTS